MTHPPTGPEFPYWNLLVETTPSKVKPRFGDFGRKKSISRSGRPKVVAKPAESQEFLYNMVLRRWIWGSLVLVRAILPDVKPTVCQMWSQTWGHHPDPKLGP